MCESNFLFLFLFSHITHLTSPPFSFGLLIILFFFFCFWCFVVSACSCLYLVFPPAFLTSLGRSSSSSNLEECLALLLPSRHSPQPDHLTRQPSQTTLPRDYPLSGYAKFAIVAYVLCDQPQLKRLQRSSFTCQHVVTTTAS